MNSFTDFGMLAYGKTNVETFTINTFVSGTCATRDLTILSSTYIAMYLYTILHVDKSEMILYKLDDFIVKRDYAIDVYSWKSDRM